MIASVGTKARKKQMPAVEALPAVDPALEQSLIALESVCMRILEDRFSGNGDDDMDRLSLQQRFKNIVTPVSLALAELKGPRRFHYHYKHRADDASVMTPVLEDALAMLAGTCERALSQCASKLVGIHDRDLIDRQRRLESALRTFLYRYQD